MRRSVVVVVVGVLGALGSAARAERDPASLLGEAVHAIEAGDAQAFAATFAPNGYVILPTAQDEGGGTAAIAAAAKHWFATMASRKLTIEKATHGDATFDAELVGQATRLRVTGVACHAGEALRICALHLSEPADDKAVVAAALAGKLPALPKVAGEDRGALKPEHIAQLADRTFDNAASSLGEVNHVALVGSAPNEHAVGTPQVHRLLARWKSLALTRIDYKTAEDNLSMGLVWGVGHVEATIGKAKLRYRVLLVERQPPAAAADSDATTALLSAHFSVATH